MAPERSEPRYALAVSIRVIDAETETDLGEVVNVSAHGLMIATSEPLTFDRCYRLHLVPPSEMGEPIEIAAQAAWSVRSLDPPCIKTGFRGMEVAEPDRVRLDGLVEASYRPEEE